MKLCILVKITLRIKYRYKLEIGSDTYLIFGENEIMYISKNNITNKISLQELEEAIRNATN